MVDVEGGYLQAKAPKPVRLQLDARQRKGSFIHSAAPKSKTEFNGAGGLLTYISFTPAVLG